MTTKRFAIRMAKDMYSNGPRAVGVPLQKAKLWSNIGHVKNHLSSSIRPYPQGAMVVTIEVRYNEEDLCSVEEMEAENKRKRDKRQDSQERIRAEWALKEARAALAEAEARVRKSRRTRKVL